MRKLAFVGVLVGISSVAHGQPPVPAGTGDADPVACPASKTQSNSQQKDVPILSNVPGVGRLFSSPVPAAKAAGPDATGAKLQHLLQAAAHLEAAGELDQARRLREQAKREKHGLLARLEALQAEVRRLRRLTGSEPAVVVEVKVVELSRTRLRQRGFDLAALRDKKADPAAAAPGQEESFAFRLLDESSPVLALLESLRKDRLLKELAQPTLMTLSGRPASLAVGGEFPVLERQADGSVATQFKTYGTELNVLPVVLEDRSIRLDIRMRLSEVDPHVRVQVGDQSFPGLRVREFETGVEMQADQTLVLGGLVQNRVTGKQDDSKAEPETPNPKAAGDKPKEVTEETELLVLITPRIVEPAVAHSARLPSRRKPTK